MCFKTDHSLLNNRIVCLSLGRAYCLPALPIVLQVRLKISICIDVVLIQLKIGQSHWWNFTGVVSNLPKRHKLTPNSLVLWLLQSFHPLFCNSLIWANNAPSKSQRPYNKNPSSTHEKPSFELLVRIVQESLQNIISYCCCPWLPHPSGVGKISSYC